MDGTAPLPRRRFLAGSASALAGAALPKTLHAQAANAPTLPPIPQGGTLRFAVSRNGSPIGTHALGFKSSAGTVEVTFDVSFQVKLGFITLYRYRHTGTETWSGGRFFSLETHTDDNGRAQQVIARRTPGGIVLRTGAAPETLLPPDLRPLTHWVRALPGEHFFNPQTGARLNHAVRPAGQAEIQLANGQVIEATGYTIAGDAPIQDWYDSTDIWAALDATGKDGSRITYRREIPA